MNQKSFHGLPNDEGTQILNGISVAKICAVINYTKHVADRTKRNDKEKLKRSTRINITYSKNYIKMFVLKKFLD